MTFNWCHGPDCHKYQTQSRVRGSGTNKVLRTRKVNTKHYVRPFGQDAGTEIWGYFCDNKCLMDYVRYHAQAIIAIAPIRAALETPIKVEKEKYESHRYKWTDSGTERVPYQATRTTIKSVDNDNG